MSSEPRPSWDEYFMGIAKTVAARSTCPRLSVGTVLVRDKKILTTGYNGAVSNGPHCSSVGCKIVDGHCVSVVHSESNALVQAARSGIVTAYSTAYITHRPCLACFKLLYQAGVKRIVFGQEYGSVDYGVLGVNHNCMPEIAHLDATDGSITTIRNHGSSKTAAASEHSKGPDSE